MESVDERKDALKEWLVSTCGLYSVCLHSELSGASFRRYFRVYSTEGSFIAMDAPPDKEKCQPYVAIAKALQEIGLKTPEMIRTDIEKGFLLMSDFGDLTYLRMLNEQNAEQLYQNALSALVILQGCQTVKEHQVPKFTRDFMAQEWHWHKEWFLGKLLGLNYHAKEKDLDTCLDFILDSAIQQPQVFMHRDFHSANLMMLPKNEVGLLDFQDAFIGPITYDLVSLLRDSYIDWPEDWVTSWVRLYWEKLKNFNVPNLGDENTFLRWFDFMGLQRHLKTIFTFTRKHLRDQQSHYLEHIPRTLSYLLNASQHYRELAPLHHYYQSVVFPAFQKWEVATCAP